MMIRIHKRVHNTKIRRWLEKRIAERSGTYTYSSVIRELYKEYYGLEIGYGTYGGCWNNGTFKGGRVKIGNYCSFAAEVYVVAGNHNMDDFTTLPVLNNTYFGAVLPQIKDKERNFGLEIGHDVWMGMNAVVTPGCHRVGNGAIIGAGAVVTHDVPPYAIVAGNPAKVLRYRFDEDTIAQLEATQWWLLTKEELKNIAPEVEAIAKHEDANKYKEL